MQIRGKQEPVRLHEIFDGDGEQEFERKIKTRPTFEEGLSLYYEKKFAEAAVRFEQVSRAHPNDVAYSLYLKRAVHLLGNGAPPDWTGVESPSYIP